MFSVESRDARTVDFTVAATLAEAIRDARDDLTQRYRHAGTLSDLRSEIAAAEADSPLRSMRLLGVCEAIPAMGGKVASRRSLAAAGLSESVLMGDLTDEQWSKLLAGGDVGTGQGSSL